jgi:signal transduction histidine kinase
MLYRRVQEFQTLTDNVLRFSELNVKEIQVKFVPINVAHLLRQVLSDARQRAALKSLTLLDHIPGNLQLVTDTNLLQIAVNNLVDNALKYTAEGHVTVRAVDLLTRVEVAVEDSGPGVPEDEREKVFELFVQGSCARSQGQEGLGLGLYISRLYVEKMGGTLRYEPLLSRAPGGGEEPSMVGSRFVAEFQRSSGRTTGE